MNIPAFLSDLRSLDIHVWADGDRLRCNAPAGALTPALREQLREQKGHIVEFLQSATAQSRAIVPIQPRGECIPIFAVGGHNGDVFCFRALARHMGIDQPFFGLQPPGLDAETDPLTSVEDLAQFFATEIRNARPKGAVIVSGYCAGGAVAFEIARRLLRAGHEVECVALLAGRYPTWFRPMGQLRHRLTQYLERAAIHGRTLASIPRDERVGYLVEMFQRLRAKPRIPHIANADPFLQARARVQQATFNAVCRYKPTATALRLCLFLPSPAARRSAEGLLRWRKLASIVEVYCGPTGCEGDAMLLEPNVRHVAEQFQRCLRDPQRFRTSCSRTGSVA